MNVVGNKDVLHIKKYPNRRYYDASRSCHVTLHEVYDLIQAGHDVVISDSRNGEDITNLVLTQVILERDPPKLDIFPAWILHLMIRSNRHALRSFVDRVFGPTMELFATSQRQWESYVRDAMSGRFSSPLDWAQTMMTAFGPGHRAGMTTPPGGTDSQSPPSDTVDSESPERNGPATVAELRRELEALTQRIETLQAEQDSTGGS
jgi:polyhydroxyalkanoate synthesis repressor PhaR